MAAVSRPKSPSAAWTSPRESTTGLAEVAAVADAVGAEAVGAVGVVGADATGPAGVDAGGADAVGVDGRASGSGGCGALPRDRVRGLAPSRALPVSTSAIA